MLKTIIKNTIEYIKLLRFQDEWRRCNPHNLTRVRRIFPIDKVSVSKKTYGVLNVRAYGDKLERLSIGSYCSIADNVTFFLGGGHPYCGLSTYPFKVHICGGKSEALTKGPIIIGDDVWIGFGSTILSGVTIGKGAIIGTGSVVAKNVPPYAIFIGNKVVKYRFSQEIIDILLEIDFNKMDEKSIKDNIDLLYCPINDQLLNSSFIREVINS
jgi:acetyltransferase-like isoleucine patch superfamily enzyme